MSVSAELGQMARDATVGMTDKEVCEKTGLSIGLWRKLHDGHTVEPGTILRFCAGLDVDVQPFLDALSRARGRGIEPDALLVAAVALLPLSQAGKRSVMTCYRRALQQEQQQSAAA